MELTITTNNVPRHIIDAWELTEKEQLEFDFLDWDKIKKGEDSASFFRYKGELYYLNDFLRIEENAPEEFKKWDGYASDSYFSGVLVKYLDYESVIVALYTS